MKTYTSKDHQKSTISLMWIDGLQDVRFNVKKPNELNEGDLVFYKTNTADYDIYYKVIKVKESRQSTLKDYNYITTECEIVDINKSITASL